MPFFFFRLDLGTKNDNFSRCPDGALAWSTRAFRILEEIVRHAPDVVCLQEVDRFPFLWRYLSPLGYVGRFAPKPDSPCLHLPGNHGPGPYQTSESSPLFSNPFCLLSRRLRPLLQARRLSPGPLEGLPPPPLGRPEQPGIP